MSNSLLPTLLLATAAGAVSALVVTSLSGSDAPAAQAVGAASAEGVSQSVAGSTEAELVSLRAENQELRVRIEALESRPAGESRAAVQPSVEELAAAVAEVQSNAGATATPRDDAMYTQVEAALESIRETERAEAAKAREQREVERMEERLTQMAERLGLTPAQTNDMRGLLLQQEQIEDDLRAQREAGMERDAYRVARDQAREAERAELTRILTPEQLQQYDARNDRGNDRGSEARNRGNSDGGAPAGGSGGNNAGGGNGGNNNGGGGNRQRRGN
jgi:uncharacterized membrane protein YgcG